MSFTLVYDVTAANYPQVPRGVQLAGYDTGPGVAWTQAMWDANPGAVHIDQEPDAGVLTSDVLDVENGAVPVGSPLLATWVKQALSAFTAGKRPGQRRPLLYQSAGNVTANVNALVAGGVTSGVGLWIAHWGLTPGEVLAELAAAAGPFPVEAIQFTDNGDFDSSLFSSAWLGTVSGGGWVFGPVRNAQFWPGHTTIGVKGYSPGTPEPLGVADYEIAVSLGSQLGAQLPGYPAYVPKDLSSAAFSFEGHGIPVHTTVTIGVRAVGPNGTHAGPWVTGTVTTGT
jgi:hypothetical protein